MLVEAVVISSLPSKLLIQFAASVVCSVTEGEELQSYRAATSLTRLDREGYGSTSLIGEFEKGPSGSVWGETRSRTKPPAGHLSYLLISMVRQRQCHGSILDREEAIVIPTSTSPTYSGYGVFCSLKSTY